MLSSSSNRATDYFGLFEIALLPVPQTDDAHDALEETHELLGKLMIALVLLHVAGALKHHAQATGTSSHAWRPGKEARPGPDPTGIFRNVRFRPIADVRSAKV